MFSATFFAVMSQAMPCPEILTGQFTPRDVAWSVVDECYGDISPREVFQSSLGFANKRTLVGAGQHIRASVSEPFKGYSQQQNFGPRITVMQWKYERRLVLAATPVWLGWFCERCCWHITLDTKPMPVQHTVDAKAQFNAHDCEEYGRQNRKECG
jgi:hypothetical protein